jgi:pre-mRNA-splicing factor ATP-dependent RNA helicase DHX38/PRP16
MASTTDQNDEFSHQIAIKLSRAMVVLNPMLSVNPNDLLARNVINLAKDNDSVEGFMKGVFAFTFYQPCGKYYTKLNCVTAY